MTKTKEEIPILNQFLELKEKHPEALLLFRVGDFYECYESDASIASLVLGITLTKRKDGGNMAGFPHHALDTYLPKLIRAGKRVAICDQLENPKETQNSVFKTDDGQFEVIEDVKPNKTEMTMEETKKQDEKQVTAQELNEVKRAAEQTVNGIATETIKALRGELPSTLANYLYEAIGKLEVIKIKHSLSFTPNRSEISFLIKEAEISRGE